jgi:hypothetical protein
MELTTMVVRASVAVEKSRNISVVFVGTNPALVAAFQHFKSVGIYVRTLEYFTSLGEARDFIANVGQQLSTRLNDRYCGIPNRTLNAP